MDRQSFNFRLEDIKVAEESDLSDYYIDPINSKNMSLGLGITDKCNLQCPMCYYRENNNKHNNTNMSLEKLTSILSDLRFIGNIVLGLEGEPLCHPEFEKVLKICSQYTNSITIVTNGLLLSEGLIKAFNKNKVKNIILSCDGADKITYEQNRVGGSFTRFCKILQLTRQLFNGLITLHAVIHNKNCNNLCNIPEFAHNNGIYNISLAQLRCNAWNANNELTRPSFTDLKSSLTSLVHQAEFFNVNITFDALFAYGELLRWIKNTLSDSAFVKITSMDICSFPWMFTSILSDGRQFLCCGDIYPNNLYKYNFDSLYNNEHIKRLRYLLANKKQPEVCRYCMTGIFKPA